MTALTEKAPAKINLTLHVRGRRADGFHDLESLVAFAGVGDRLSLTPGDALSLDVSGRTAEASGATGDNLVLRATREAQARIPGLRAGAFTLIKNLPVAAGLGGGSSDAGAALRLLARANSIATDDPRLFEIAAAVGSDVPVCLAAKACMMRGRGDDLGPPLALPRLFAVLVHPGVAVPTAPVFAALGLTPGECPVAAAHPDIEGAAIAALRGARNDLEDAACVIAPAIRVVLEALMLTACCQLARMSGSGATCFGLFDNCHAAARAGASIRRAHPQWWVRSTILR